MIQFKNPIRSRAWALQQKLEKPVTYIFKTNPKYVMYILWMQRKKYNVHHDQHAERVVKSASQDILNISWAYLHFLWFYVFYHSVKKCDKTNEQNYRHWSGSRSSKRIRAPLVRPLEYKLCGLLGGSLIELIQICHHYQPWTS